MASVGAWASVGAGAIVGAGARVGARARVGAWARVGDGARVGAWASVTRDLADAPILSGWAKYDWTTHRDADGVPVLHYGCESHRVADWTPALQRKLCARHDPAAAADLRAIVATVRAFWKAVTPKRAATAQKD